ncbi:unnamed protein product [Phytomonas sp. EM1]|nr:unnamed protein product [Phytomonas sp. EM1]|eukprot:CCW61866.1 unnamed protein product [Phytomonas sp. isolate EM1]
MRRSISNWQKQICMDRTAIRRAERGTVGYGPFSKTVKGHSALEKHRREVKPSGGGESHGDDAASVMNNIQLSTNLYLRLSLASLLHPTQLEKIPYQSPEWRLAMVSLYRAILRLHNKTVAVSLEKSKPCGLAKAVGANPGADSTTTAREKVALKEMDEKNTKGPESSSMSKSSEDATGDLKFPESNLPPKVTLMDRFVLKYLLNDAQREFGNRFVHDEFHRHTDADHVAASIFYRSWYEYVLQLSSGVTTREMTEDEKRWLTDEQRVRLEQLKTAFRQVVTPQEVQYMP